MLCPRPVGGSRQDRPSGPWSPSCDPTLPAGGWRGDPLPGLGPARRAARRPADHLPRPSERRTTMRRAPSPAIVPDVPTDPAWRCCPRRRTDIANTPETRRRGAAPPRLGRAGARPGERGEHVLTVPLILLLTNRAGPSRTGADGNVGACASAQVRVDAGRCTRLRWTGVDGRHRPSKPLRWASPTWRVR